MAAPERTDLLDTLYTSTWQNRRKEVTDQIFNATPFFLEMTKKGRLRHEEGGLYIEEPLRKSRNDTTQWIGRGGSVTFAEQDPITVSQWQWRYLTGHILRYFADDQKNRGRAQWLNKVNTDIDTLTMSLTEDLETAMFGDGTGDDSKAIQGLQSLVDTTPTASTVGGLNRATYDWWRNIATTMTTLQLSVSLIPYMTKMYNDCGALGGGQRFPDLIVTTQAIHEAYEAEAQEIGQVQMPRKEMMDLGFGSLAFKSCPIVWSSFCPDYSMYFLNTGAMSFIVDPIKWLSLGKWLDIPTQVEDKVAHSMSVCILAVNNMKKLGVLYNIGN